MVWSLVERRRRTRASELDLGSLAAAASEPRSATSGRRRPAARSSACTASRATAGTSARSRSASPTASTSSRSTCAAHGGSPWEPPWNLEQHVADVLDAAPNRRCAWLGHSFGGRIAYEAAAAAPIASSGSSCSIRRSAFPPQSGLLGAENARRDRSYASFDEGIDRRYEESVLTTAPRELVEAELREHLLPDDDGRWRYRYCQSAVVAAYGEMTREQPPFSAGSDPDAARARRDLVPPLRRACSTITPLHSATCSRSSASPAGHTVLWDALDDTAGAIERFLL